MGPSNGTSAERFRSSLDGTSNTIVASEVIAGRDDTSAGDATWDVRGLWAWHMIGGAAYTHRNTPNSIAGDALQGQECVADLPDLPCDNSCPNLLDCEQACARSRHPGGVQAVFGDGHVTFCSNVITLQIWRALSTVERRRVGDGARLACKRT